jgi:hypothetical protein
MEYIDQLINEEESLEENKHKKAVGEGEENLENKNND